MATLYRRQKRDGTRYPTYTADKRYRGHRINGDTGCTTKGAALAWVREREREIDEQIALNLHVNGHKADLTLEEAIHRYVLEKLGDSSSYEKTERYYVKRFIGFFDAANKKLRDLSTDDVARYVTARTREGVTGSSVVRELTVLRSMHTWAREVWEHDTRTIAWKKIWPKAKQRARHKPTVAEVHALIEAASERLKPAITFAVLTGLRLHEVYKLKTSDVDFKNKTMTVLGKGKKETLVPLSSAATSILSSQQPLPSGRFFNDKNFRREWDETRKRAGLEHIVFHGLRHATATVLAEMGVPMLTIQMILRHSSIGTTSMYTGMDAKLVSSALESLAKSLQSSQTNGSTGSSESPTGNAQSGMASKAS